MAQESEYFITRGYGYPHQKQVSKYCANENKNRSLLAGKIKSGELK